MGRYADKACELFVNDANCAQAVFAAFADKMGLDRVYALKLASSFGGGMGRLREVCGAVSGMFMVAGALYGYDYNDDEKKKEHYALIQKLAAKFTAEHGTIICRDLLKIASEVPSPIPTKRDAEFYKARPCVRFVETAARLTEELIEDKE
ncbi:MAG: C_GCAxxG_C_C family protein [Ruminococcaceae bacterium]|nr:C_GCAxxG_C_C family protein [Oscillospiraceae bacterium]